MTATFEALWGQFHPVVEGVAAEYARSYRRWGADAEDFRQEFVLWMLDHEAELAESLRELGPEQFEKYLARCLRNEGNDYGVDIRDQAGGQPRHDAYFYSTGELKTLLPSVFDPEAWLNPPQYGGENRSSRAPAEGNNWVATLSDVSRAFSQLDLEDQALLRDYHQHGIKNKELAQAFKVTEATMSYRHTQALKRLLKHLGGPRPSHMRPDTPHDPWRGRHAVSNSQARAMTSAQYEED